MNSDDNNKSNDIELTSPQQQQQHLNNNSSQASQFNDSNSMKEAIITSSTTYLQFWNYMLLDKIDIRKIEKIAKQIMHQNNVANLIYQNSKDKLSERDKIASIKFFGEISNNKEESLKLLSQSSQCIQENNLFTDYDIKNNSIHQVTSDQLKLQINELEDQTINVSSIKHLKTFAYILLLGIIMLSTIDIILTKYRLNQCSFYVQIINLVSNMNSDVSNLFSFTQDYRLYQNQQIEITLTSINSNLSTSLSNLKEDIIDIQAFTDSNKKSIYSGQQSIINDTVNSTIQKLNLVHFTDLIQQQTIKLIINNSNESLSFLQNHLMNEYYQLLDEYQNENMIEFDKEIDNFRLNVLIVFIISICFVFLCSIVLIALLWKAERQKEKILKLFLQIPLTAIKSMIDRIKQVLFYLEYPENKINQLLPNINKSIKKEISELSENQSSQLVQKTKKKLINYKKFLRIAFFQIIVFIIALYFVGSFFVSQNILDNMFGYQDLYNNNLFQPTFFQSIDNSFRQKMLNVSESNLFQMQDPIIIFSKGIEQMNSIEDQIDDFIKDNYHFEKIYHTYYYNNICSHFQDNDAETNMQSACEDFFSGVNTKGLLQTQKLFSYNAQLIQMTYNNDTQMISDLVYQSKILKSQEYLLNQDIQRLYNKQALNDMLYEITKKLVNFIKWIILAKFIGICGLSIISTLILLIIWNSTLEKLNEEINIAPKLLDIIPINTI